MWTRVTAVKAVMVGSAQSFWTMWLVMNQLIEAVPVCSMHVAAGKASVLDNVQWIIHGSFLDFFGIGLWWVDCIVVCSCAFLPYESTGRNITGTKWAPCCCLSAVSGIQLIKTITPFPNDSKAREWLKHLKRTSLIELSADVSCCGVNHDKLP